MWYVLINSQWRKARRYDYNFVMPFCQNVCYSIDSELVKFKPSNKGCIMMHYSSNIPLFRFPHCHAMWSCYQDNGFGNHVAVELDSTQVILFITEDLH